jgi:hypothetical protein
MSVAPSRADGSSERGAYLILWALLVVGVMIMVALVLDLGSLRSDRRGNQTITDLAALAAGPRLAQLPTPDAVGACEDAFRYARTNTPGLAGMSNASIDTACAPLSCDPSSPPATGTDATISVGDFSVTVRYPIPAGELSSTTAADGSTCERMRVSIDRTVDSFFAKIIGVDTLTSHSSSMVRGFSSTIEKQVAALLVLERIDCGALRGTASGAGAGGILVLPFDADHPGLIGVDSYGDQPPCNNTTTANGYVVFGKQLPPSSERPNAPSIEAQGLPSGAPGRIDLWALRVGSPHTAYPVPSGVAPAPTPGDITSRGPVDVKYNSTNRITNFRSSVGTRVNWNVVTARTNLFTVYPEDFVLLGIEPNAKCNAADHAPIPASYSNVFINCPGGPPTLRFQPNNLTFLGDGTFIVNGETTIGSGNRLLFPNAKEVLIKGSASNGLNNQGYFYVNTGTMTTVPAPPVPSGDEPAPGDPSLPGTWSCTQDRGKDDGVTQPSVVAIHNGPLTSSTSAAFKLCQTFVYMSGSGIQQFTGDAAHQCNSFPCPLNNAYTGALSVFGAIDWSAPNQHTTDADPAGPTDTQPFEDLAMWTEASSQSEIKGQGASRTSGVYFFPNATIVFSGQSSQNIKLNAQFFARKIDMSGQGTLALKPNPRDSVETKKPSWSLIR